MKYQIAAALSAFALLFPSGVLAQGGGSSLTITNYRLVNEQRSTYFETYYTYSAELINSGGARSAITASLASTVPTTKIVTGQNRLQFPPVPAGGRVQSTNTFTILVDRRATFRFDDLQWTFLTPIADAGPDQTGLVGATINLNGSASSTPPNTGTLSYLWEFLSKPASSSPQFSSPNSVTTSFVLSAPGTYVIQLTVANSVGSEKDTLVVSTINSKPVANAGANQTVAVGAQVSLNGGASSDVDGDPLGFVWTFVARPNGSGAAFNNSQSATPNFTADKAGIYIAQLVVSDGKLSSDPATVTITTSNTQPVANAGQNQTVNVGTLVQLNGAGSTDVDGDPLTFQWSLTTVPSGSNAALSNATIVNPTFTADKPGTYVAQLIVNDGKLASAPKTVSISTNAVQAPTANAGAAQTVKRFATVTLSGSGTDPQSLPLTYQWSLTTRPSNSNAALTNPTSQSPTFVADQHGTYIAQLIVNNGFQSSAPATVTINTSNTTPVANAGPNQTVSAGSLVTLTGSASSDADQDPLTYAWSLTTKPDGSTATLLAATSVSPTFVADLAGTYVAQLIVNDGLTSSTPVTVTITANPAGTLLLPANTTLGLGQTAPFAISLPANAGPNGVVVTLASSDSNKVTVSTQTVTIPAGQKQPAAQPTVTGVGLGSANITASAPGYTSASGAVQVGAGLSFNPTSLSLAAGQTSNLTLNLSANAPTGGVIVNLSSDTTAVATVPPTVQIPQGSNSATVAVTGVATGTAVITASGANLTSATANITVGAALSITTASLPNGTVGQAYSQTLAATGGKSPYTWALTSGSLPANLTLDASTGLISGTPTAAVTNTPLTFRVTDSNNPALTKEANFTLTIAAQVPASIAATAGTPQSATVGAGFATALAATVKDANGNPVAGVTVTFAAPASGASGTFAGGTNTAVTGANGVATAAAFTANTVAGAYTVTATVSGVAAGANFALTNNPGPAASITATAGTPQSAAVGTAFAIQLAATVKDANGNLVPGVTVTFAAPASGASGAFAGGTNTAVTGPNGVATAGIFTANATVGGYNVAASAPGVASPANFALTNVAGPPASIAVVSGTPQSANTGAQFTNPLVVIVKDAGGNPISGVTVTFTAPTSGASATFAGNANTAITTASGQATSALLTANATAGSYTVNASVAGLQSTVNFNLTNVQSGGGGGPITVTGTTVGKDLQASISITLPVDPPVTGLKVTLSSNNPNVLVAGRATEVGVANLTIDVFTKQFTAFVQGLANAGSATITVSATGLTNGTSTVNLSASGFMIFLTSNQSVNVRSFTVPESLTQSLTVTSARLESNLGFVENQSVRPGIAAPIQIPLTLSPNSQPAIGSVNPAVVVFNGGDATKTVTFTGLKSGSVTVTAEAPSGFSPPAQLGNKITGTVLPAGVVTQNVTVGFNLQTTLQVRLNSPAPSTGLIVTVVSSDPTKVVFSDSALGQDTATLNLNVSPGSLGTQPFYVRGLASSGTVNYSATAPGLGTATGIVTLASSGFIFTSPGTSLLTTTGAANTPITVDAVVITPTGMDLQSIRGSLAQGITVTVTNSNPTAGSITTNPLPFGPGAFSVSTQFDPSATGGLTTLGLTQPTGGAPPAGTSIAVNVIQPGMSILNQVTVGNKLQTSGSVLLGQPAPSGGVQIVLTVTGGSILLSKSPTAAGSNSITLDVAAGQSVSSTYYIQGTGSTGTATYSAQAPGYANRTGTVFLAPSGVIIYGLFGPGAILDAFLSGGLAGPQPFTVEVGFLDAFNGFVTQQPVAGGQTVTVTIGNSNAGVGTATTPVVISASNATAEGSFSPLTVGQTILSATAGLTTPSQYGSVTARVR